MRHPSTHRPLVSAVVAAIFAVALVACGGGERADSTSTASTTEAPDQGGAQDGHGAHVGAAMGIDPGTVADVAALGPGPEVGDSWQIPVGVNVCGRFVEVPAGGPVGAVTAQHGGLATVAPGDDAAAGHAATVGDYAQAAGVTLSEGSLGLPAGIAPDAMEVGDTTIPLAGRTFSTGDSCGTTPAEVQVWVYSADAVTSGEGILVVTEDPERVPFVEDGMAVVIALTPDSSLPTLPPSALGIG